jgi:diguanylate cyclase (GGDEF)-like protein
VIGLVVASVDVTDRRAYEKALAEKAITDGLTGLRNHRHFRERLDEEFEVSCEYGSPLSVVLLDVDHFKQYNDSFGHPAGDDVLRGVAAILAENAPEGALVSRYGGEEFVILAPGLDDDAVFEVAEKIRAALEAREWPNRAITASFGFSTFGPGFPTAADLVDSADKALYESKRSGRNRVTHFESLPAAA